MTPTDNSISYSLALLEHALELVRQRRERTRKFLSLFEQPQPDLSEVGCYDTQGASAHH